MSGKSRDSRAGFALVEVLAALVLVLLTLGVVYQAYGTAFDTSARAERVTEALLAAESKLTELGAMRPLRAGASSGTLADGYSWRAVVSAYREGLRSDPDAMPVRAFDIEVTVAWGGRAHQSVTLGTIRVVPRGRDG